MYIYSSQTLKPQLSVGLKAPSQRAHSSLEPVQSLILLFTQSVRWCIQTLDATSHCRATACPYKPMTSVIKPGTRLVPHIRLFDEQYLRRRLDKFFGRIMNGICWTFSHALNVISLNKTNYIIHTSLLFLYLLLLFFVSYIYTAHNHCLNIGKRFLFWLVSAYSFYSIWTNKVMLVCI